MHSSFPHFQRSAIYITFAGILLKHQQRAADIFQNCVLQRSVVCVKGLKSKSNEARGQTGYEYFQYLYIHL